MSGLAMLASGVVFAGDYRVERPLGEGGMGAVYVAEQLSTARKCALKVMQPALVGNAEMRERFLREARIGARLKSDFVVQVLQAGVDDATQMPWLAMELLEGEDLEAHLTRVGSVTPAELVALFDQLCDALGEAHRAGIVHRDLKLENVFLAKPRRRTDRFTVKVLDFGIARMIAEARTTSAQTKGAIGTPLFMAPEQAKPGAPITPATDVWALGLIAFRLLTGRHFWLTAYDPASSVMMIAMEAYVTPLPSASERAAHFQCTRPVSAAFDAWFAKCVAREPSDRFPSATEAFHGLERALNVPTGQTGVVDRGPAAAELAFAPTIHGPTPASIAGGTVAARPLTELAPPGARTDTNAFSVPGAAGFRPGASGPRAPRRPARPTRVWWGAGIVVLIGLVGLIVWQAATGSGRRSRPNTAETTTLRASGPSASNRGVPAATATGPVNGGCPNEMAAIPAGTFTMGSADGDPHERPTFAVTLPPYCVDRTEVTVDAYAACVKETKCTDVHVRAWSADGAQFTQAAECNYGSAGRGDHPMNCVDALEAEAYCRSRGKQLPTEQQWEYAARGGSEQRRYPWAGGDPPSNQLCWRSSDPQRPGTCKVGSYAGGDARWGVHDMAGNVWEWTSSADCEYPLPSAKCSALRVNRGGSWDLSGAEYVRSAFRSRAATAVRNQFIGFRCVRPLP